MHLKRSGSVTCEGVGFGDTAAVGGGVSVKGEI